MFEQNNDKPGSGRWIKAVAVAATAVAVASLAIAGTVAAQTGQQFNDVPRSHWAYDPIQWAVANGITQGCGDGRNFCPDRTLTRAHMVTFLMRYHEQFGGSATDGSSGSDDNGDDPDEWVVSGFGTTTFADAISLPAGNYLVDFVLVHRSAITEVAVTVGGPLTTSERNLLTIEAGDVTESNGVHTARSRASFEVRTGLGRLPPGKIYFTVTVTGTSIGAAEWEIRVTER